MKSTVLVFAVLAMIAQPLIAQETNKRTAVFNQQWLKALVSIELLETADTRKSIGSGFLVQTPNNHIALVTAKHVVYADQGKGPLLPRLSYRLNDTKGKSILLEDDYATSFKGGWVRSETFDIACRLIIRKDTSDTANIPYSAFLPAKQVQAGAPLFIIGFPLGMRSEEYATPIVRRAIVARSDPNNIIADGFVFPGNSGGPVIYEPSIQLGTGFTTSILQGVWLVGMVVSEIAYVESAISVQTGKTRVTFEQNSGLCNVIPADLILDVLRTPEFQKLDETLR